MSNLLAAIVAFAIVVYGAYYLYYKISPSDRDSVMVEYTEGANEAQKYMETGLEEARKYLPAR